MTKDVLENWTARARDHIIKFGPEKLYSEKLLQELLDYNPPMYRAPRPDPDRIAMHGFDWDYELDRLKERMHNQIDEAFAYQRMMDVYRATGMLMLQMPLQVRAKKPKFIIDPIS